MDLFGISISAYILSLISIVLFSYVLILIISLIRNKGIDDIGKKAFKGCLNLKSVQANYVKNIGESAFERMYKARNNYYE